MRGPMHIHPTREAGAAFFGALPEGSIVMMAKRSTRARKPTR